MKSRVTVDAPRKVLVVDDEENIRYLLQTSLTFHGFEVSSAETGREAVDQYRAIQPDIVLLDVMLPDFDGFEVLRRLRAEGPTCPVIFLTARDTTADQVRGLTLGGDDYVAKPFSLEALVARIGVQLRKIGKSTDDGILRYDDLMLADDAHRVERAGQLIELSATEFKVLRYLMVNAERVVSKDQLLDYVWHYDFDGETSIVENFISLVRKKVDVGRHPLIKTIRGVGYVLRRD
jgi:two-component system, OmpR family, response regulator